MKVTLIVPGVAKRKDSPYIDAWKLEPLALAVLAGLTPLDIEVRLIDDRIEQIPYDEPTDLVAITVETVTAKRAYQISSRYREQGIPVVLGGFHPTLIPDEAIEHADTVLIGEAEGIWEKIIEDVKKNRLKKFYKSKQRPLLKGIRPRREIFKGKQYLPFSMVETARGCRFSCNFCSVSAFFNSTYNTRPIPEVIAEIEKMENLDREVLYLVDDNINSNFERTKKFLKALIPLRINWIGQGSINMANDRELLKLIAKSGCIYLMIGLESLNNKNLTQMAKNCNTKINLETAIKKINDHGVGVYATFVFGYDYDNPNSFDETLEFALKYKLFLASFNILVPFPHTPIYDILSKQRRLLYDKWWLNPRYRLGNVVFQPKLMSPEQLHEGCSKINRIFYRKSFILERLSNLMVCNDSQIRKTLYFSQNFSIAQASEGMVGLLLGEGLDSRNK